MKVQNVQNATFNNSSQCQAQFHTFCYRQITSKILELARQIDDYAAMGNAKIYKQYYCTDRSVRRRSRYVSILPFAIVNASGSDLYGSTRTNSRAIWCLIR
jgi:hypothetical protein